MDLEEKLGILTDAAKYDVSCASSGVDRKGAIGGTGNSAACGICHSWTADGRCVSLLKLLYTNACVYDCAYCVNRRSNDVPRASFTPQEVAGLTMAFYRRNMIEGLFLSSAVAVSPDRTMERLIRVAEILRLRERFGGYIHMKVIPGASRGLVERLGYLADRVSVNIEFPTDQELALMAPDKTPEGIKSNMLTVRDRRLELLPTLYRGPKPPAFVPAGQSTQMILGAGDSDDREVLGRAESLYQTVGMKRVYYSAYVPVNLPPEEAVRARTPLLREHRVYQADWLMRFYGFEAREILGERRFLDQKVDPKIAWAVDNFHLFPLDVNTAPREMLLRVPGLGPRTVQRILAARRLAAISYDSLAKTGAVMKRARHFVTAFGRRPYPLTDDPERVYRALAGADTDACRQLSFLDAV
ncbi:MAG: putative DNA modification/repair radical SAM protein [Eubacteriales bacterium]|nr:putative DNA modification/repair radical SAM protein [Eubacteriales bacterium]